MTPEDFRKAGHRVIDWIADYRATVESRPVMAQTEPGAIKALMPAEPPQQPESFDFPHASLPNHFHYTGPWHDAARGDGDASATAAGGGVARSACHRSTVTISTA